MEHANIKAEAPPPIIEIVLLELINYLIISL
jgi:hypothetical protein